MLCCPTTSRFSPAEQAYNHTMGKGKEKRALCTSEIKGFTFSTFVLKFFKGDQIAPFPAQDLS